MPSEAVQQGPEGFFVLFKADGSVEMRKVETVASDAGVTAIGAGLQAGETVVTDGQLPPDAGRPHQEQGHAGVECADSGQMSSTR